MAQEVRIHTWCDPCLELEEKKVDGETLSVLIDGVRWDMDMCASHQVGTSVTDFYEAFEKFGRVWVDPDTPTKKRRRRKERSEPESEDEPTARIHGVGVDSKGRPYKIEHGYVNEDGWFVCTFPDCPKEGEPMPKIQSLRMHQRKAHDIHVPEEDRIR